MKNLNRRVAVKTKTFNQEVYKHNQQWRILCVYGKDKYQLDANCVKQEKRSVVNVQIKHFVLKSGQIQCKVLAQILNSNELMIPW